MSVRYIVYWSVGRWVEAFAIGFGSKEWPKPRIDRNKAISRTLSDLSPAERSVRRA